MSAWAKAYGRLPLPADLNWLWTIGAVLCAILALMLLTGLTLTLVYTPDAGLAFGSVESIERRMPAGWLLRAMHMTGASFFMLALYVHLLRGLYYRSYLPPRRAVWLSGCALLVMVMVTAFAGYVLPWGQMSYWGADVAGKAVGALPLAGGWLEGVFLGGDSPGTPTLHRMFALHFGLAFLIVGVVLGHIAHVHARGSSSPSARPTAATGVLPFHPYFTVRDMLAIVLVALAFVGVLCFWPELIVEPANYRPANPLHTPADIEPEWYFLPFYGMMQAVPFKLGGCCFLAERWLFCLPSPGWTVQRMPPIAPPWSCGWGLWVCLSALPWQWPAQACTTCRECGCWWPGWVWWGTTRIFCSICPLPAVCGGGAGHDGPAVCGYWGWSALGV